MFSIPIGVPCLKPRSIVGFMRLTSNRLILRSSYCRELNVEEVRIIV